MRTRQLKKQALEKEKGNYMERQYIITRAIKWVRLHFLLSGILLLLLWKWNQQEILRYLLLTVLLFEHIAMMIVLYHRVLRYLLALNKTYEAFARGYIVYDIFEQPIELSKEHASMMRQMNELLEKKDVAELYTSQAEYMALQNQINPHFLYNTLEGIRSEALIGGLPMVGEMTETLARFFRYTISNLRSMVTVEDELLNIRHYCEIQKFRMGEKISYQVIFDNKDEEEVKSLCMPKLILQPIVENAILHGIEPLLTGGKISVRFQVLSSRLLIMISDNGSGMDRAKLEKLNEQMRKTKRENDEVLQKQGGIALQNVNSRIKLLLGQDYGLRFYSKLGHGTDVEISLPIIEEEAKQMGERNG